MTGFGIGQSVSRKEDQRLLTGQGRFVDDRSPSGALHAWFLRSPHAHAEISNIETSHAKSLPGVVAVYTGSDIVDAGLGGLPCNFMPKDPDGVPGYAPEFPLLAGGQVRFVGQSVVLVIADSESQAREAAEAIEIGYAERPSASFASATSEDAPIVWPDAPDNVAFSWELGDRQATDAAFAQADHRVALNIINNRVVVAAMETRGGVASHDRATGRSTLWTASQMPHPLRADMGRIFSEPEDRFRIVVEDVGGGFGIKNSTYAEQALIIWAARKLGRPVKWIGERTDAFVTDFHARDNIARAELALDADGRFLGLRVDVQANIGAYFAGRGGISPVFNQAALIGCYRTPAAHVRSRGVFSHTVPTDVYRGAGRPEAVHIIERLVDFAAAEIGIDRITLRRRNMIAPSVLPYATPLGLNYDSGEYERTLDEGMQTADWAGFENRRKQASMRGRLRGIGLANFVERCGAGVTEGATLEITDDGSAVIRIGTMANGQGHETAYAQIGEDLLGIPFDKISVIQGDTDAVATGQGTGGSRSIPLGGAAMSLAADTLIETARETAAEHLEAAVADIEFNNGAFVVAGTDRACGWQDVARLISASGDGAALSQHADFVPPNHTFPNGCHVCEVEVDPETGACEIVAYQVVHDFGRILNPQMLIGQVHGGVVQGLGQAKMENTVFDADGQLLTASFMDYALPRADDVPEFVFVPRETPCPSNPMGFKGCGEAGAAGAPPAFVNAVVDALSPLGVKHIDMPVTAETVWQTINRARKGNR